MGSRHGGLWLIVLAALALRLALWAQPLHQPANDEQEYIAVAHDLLEGRGWSFYLHYHWLRAPLYPLFLAGSLWLARGSLHLASLPNIVLSTATVLLVYQFTRLVQEHTNPPVAREGTAAPLLAALLAALLFTLATFASLFMGETLFTFLFLASLVLLMRWKQQREGRKDHHPGWLLLALAGVAYGLATLTRSVTVGFLPAVVLWITVVTWYRYRGDGWLPIIPIISLVRRVAWNSVVFVVCVVLTIAPWTLRNCRAYDRCILVETGLSYNLWAFSEPHEDPDEIFRTLEGIPNPATRADEATRRGLARLREDPAILLRKLWPNWVALWRVKPIEDRFLMPNYYADPPPPVFLGALLLDDALYLLIATAGIIGICHALTRGSANRVLAALLPGLWLSYLIVTTMLTHGEGRYRHFLFPVLIPYAAVGLLLVVQWLRGGGGFWRVPRLRGLVRLDWMGKWKTRLSLICTTLLGLVLFTALDSYPWEWAARGATRSLYRLAGDAALALGSSGVAEVAYQRAYAAQKTADGQLLLGDLYHRQGRADLAEQAYRSAWQRRKRYVAASARLGNLLRAQGRSKEAREAFEGYFVSEQEVTDWSWKHLDPPTVKLVDVGNGLDFGYVGGVHHAEQEQGATARWTNGKGTIRRGGPTTSPPPSPMVLTLRMAAPHPDRDVVPVHICTEGPGGESKKRCQTASLEPTWRVVRLLVSPADGLSSSRSIELRSSTFLAPDGRRLGVLLDRVRFSPVPNNAQHAPGLHGNP
jgi:4-amino-4-deoxy-L-arabinose transferase-like glycosyltransferase